MLSSGIDYMRYRYIDSVCSSLCDYYDSKRKAFNDFTKAVVDNYHKLKPKPHPKPRGDDSSDGLSTRSYDHDILMNILNGRNTRQTDNRKRLLI